MLCCCNLSCRLKKIQEKKKRQKAKQEEETIIRLAAQRERDGEAHGGRRWYSRKNLIPLRNCLLDFVQLFAGCYSFPFLYCSLLYSSL